MLQDKAHDNFFGRGRSLTEGKNPTLTASGLWVTDSGWPVIAIGSSVTAFGRLVSTAVQALHCG